MPNFVKKMNIKSVTTKYGEILKIGIHKSVFEENNVDGEWLNVDVLRSKEEDKPYLVINDYKKSETTGTHGETELNEEFIDEDEIPF